MPLYIIETARTVVHLADREQAETVFAEYRAAGVSCRLLAEGTLGRRVLATHLLIRDSATQTPRPADTGATIPDPREARQDPRHPMFRFHNCWKCRDGERPCIKGNPSRCEYPWARND